MTKKIEYAPDAILYRWHYKEDDGQIRLIGTDPALGDSSKLFRWIDAPEGWNDREPWSGGTTKATWIDPKLGSHSGWPGAIPVSRAVGRPKKEIADNKEIANDERPERLSTTVWRAELIEIMRRAADAKQTVPEWIAAVLRKELVEDVDGARE